MNYNNPINGINYTPNKQINYIIITSAVLNAAILGCSITTFYYVNKLSQISDYLNDIQINSILDNETLVIEYINRVPHIIDVLCEMIHC
jgi:hypothetical protein